MFRPFARPVVLTAALLAAALFAVPRPAAAQTAAATLTGTVTDTTGAVVPGVVITATHAATGLKRTAASSKDGIYTLPLLPPGNYTLTAAQAGFAPVEIRDVILQVGDRVALEVKLSVGQITESITVAADAGQLQLKSESGERSEVITNRQVRDLALNGRNILDLVKTLPGVVSNVNGQVSSDSQWGNFNINGTRGTMKQMTVDGTSNVIAGANNRAQVTVNPDAIAEVKVLTSNFQAEYGKAGGGVLQFTTRAGTSRLHGGVRYFRRHDSLNANRFFNNARGVDRPLYRYNYYGYDIGGPVRIPGSNFNRNNDKLFFFWNQEFYRQLQPGGAQSIRVPTALERAGDFSQTTDGNGNPIYIRDPLATGACTAAVRTACFPGNVIPSTRFFKDGRNILNIYPMANDALGGARYNYTSQISTQFPRREDIVRIDYNITERTRLNGRMIHNTEQVRQPYGGGGNITFNFPLTYLGSHQAPLNFAFTLIHTFSPTLTNEAMFGYSRSVTETTDPAGRLFREPYGIQFPLFYPNTAGARFLPNIQFGGIANQSFPTLTLGPVPRGNSNPTTNYTDNLMKVSGDHMFKFGVFFQRSLMVSSPLANENATINFSNDVNNPLNTGHPFANALLGIYANYNQANTTPFGDYRYNNLEWYVQDTWKVSRRLTLDYGLRLSWIQPQYDEKLQTNFFVPDTYDRSKAVRLYQPVLMGTERRAVDPAARPAVLTAQNTLPSGFIGLIVPGSGDPYNGIQQSRLGYARGGFDDRGIQWGPRFGFAWDITGRGSTVVRGGYGISYDRLQTNVISAFMSVPPTLVQPRLLYGYLSDLPNSQGVLAPVGAIGVARDGKVPNVHSFSLGVQRNLGRGTILDVAYVGTLARHLVQVRNLNAVPYFTTFQKWAQDPSQYANNVVPDVEPALPAAYSRADFNFSGAKALPVDFLRPYPGYGDLNYREFAGSSNYHSLQVQFRRSLSHGLTFGVAYTWSKAMDTGNADFDANNPYNTRKYDYGLADFDRTHMLVANYVYNLPKFAGRLGDGRVAKALLNDWQISGISQFSSGAPGEFGFAIQGVNAGQRILGTYSTQPMLYRYGGAPYSSGNLHLNPDGYYAPAIGDIGPYPRQYLRGPAWANHDVSVFKNIPLHGEGRFLQLRLEMFNFLNHTEFSGVNMGVQLTAPSGAIGNAIFSDYPNARITNNLRPAGSSAPTGQYFGEYSGARDPRIIQLGVKVYF